MLLLVIFLISSVGGYLKVRGVAYLGVEGRGKRGDATGE